jgi:hypothetical protein
VNRVLHISSEFVSLDLVHAIIEKYQMLYLIEKDKPVILKELEDVMQSSCFSSY